MEINEEVRKWLSEIGEKGGIKSKRTLTPEESKRMNDRKRELRKRLNDKNA